MKFEIGKNESTHRRDAEAESKDKIRNQNDVTAERQNPRAKAHCSIAGFFRTTKGVVLPGLKVPGFHPKNENDAKIERR